jgi:histone-lysine N-methyltransferase MLL3
MYCSYFKAGHICYKNFRRLSVQNKNEYFTIIRVFNILGHTWAHHCCAAWSEGVIQNEDCVLKYVDQAVVSGLSKVSVTNT